MADSESGRVGWGLLLVGLSGHLKLPSKYVLHSALDKESSIHSADSTTVTREWTQKSLIRAKSE